MESFTPEHSRLVCALLTGVVAALAATGMRPTLPRRGVLLLVLVAAVANILLLVERRVSHSNLGHYYVGAKYPGSYDEFYRRVLAGRGEPQVAFRDLHTHKMTRTDTREQRLYLIDLLNRASVSFPPSATLLQLEGITRSNGLLAAEADALLGAWMEPREIAAFKVDLERVKVDVNDYGFNGSPLYALVRLLDPSLHRPFGPAVFWFNLAWQLGALGLMVWMTARALAWPPGWGLGIYALVLSSWDYAGWGLNGLVVAGWMFPALLALYGAARGSPWVFGFGVAWAGLVKLFPFAMMLPVGVLLVQGVAQRRLGTDVASGPSVVPWCVRALVACCAGTVVLFGLSLASGYSWIEFLQKIRLQIGSADYAANIVGLANIVSTAGVAKSHALIVPQLAALLALVWICWMRDPREALARIPHMGLLLVGCLCWLTICFNYYYVPALLLLPGLARDNRRLAAQLVALFAVSMALPEFGRSDPDLAPYVSVLKMAPYLALPLVALGLEVRAVASQGRPAVTDRVSAWFFRQRAALLVLGTLLPMLAVIADVYRVNTTDFYLRSGQRLRTAGHASAAMDAYARAVRLSPGRWDAHFGFGCAADAAGDAQAAAEHYFRALECDPQAVSALNNLGVLFVRQGKPEAALAAWEEVVRIVPYDQVGRVNLGHALAALGRTDDAALQYRTALVIDPQSAEAKAGLSRLGLAE